MNDMDMANKNASRGPSANAPRPQGVSVATTLYKTLALVGLTIGFMVLVRVVPPLARAANHMASTRAWQALYPVFAAESGEQRERLIMIGIIVVCFVCALVLVEGGSWCLRRFRRPRGA